MMLATEFQDYTLSGLHVRSCIALPGLTLCDPAAEPDVYVREGHVTGAGTLLGAAQAGFRTVGDALLLAIRDVGTFSVRGGSEIVIDAQPGAPAADLGLYVMGPALGAILHQRGVFPLHASAVEVRGQAIAFSGATGAGKSTLAAFLNRRGYPLLADDVSAIAFGEAGAAAVWPGPPRLKLAPEGLDALAKQVASLQPAGGTRDKYQLPVARAAGTATPVPLRRLYILADGAGDPRTEPLSGLVAIDAVGGQTYCPEFVHSLGLQAGWFALAVRLAQAIEVRRLIRPRGFQHMERVLDVLEREAATL
jgi:hypothetical protein